jgi:hypothetical protein
VETASQQDVGTYQVSIRGEINLVNHAVMIFEVTVVEKEQNQCKQVE